MYEKIDVEPKEMTPSLLLKIYCAQTLETRVK